MDTKKFNLDDLMVGEIGQLGRFHMGVFILCGIMLVFTTWSNNEYVFSTTRINTRCRIPECDLVQPEFSPPWYEYAVPDGCSRYGSTSIPPMDGICTRDQFDWNVTLPCEDFLYETTDSVVYDFDLACQEWRRSAIGTFTKLGAMLGMPITGYASDRWGRRISLLSTGFFMAILGLVRYWTKTYITFVFSEFIESVMGYGCSTCCIIYVMEYLGPKYRATGTAAMQTCTSLAQIALALIAWAAQNWRTYTLAIYIPQFIIISYIWFLPESARWSISKGRYAESEALIQKIAKVNKKTVSTQSLEALRETAKEDRQRKSIEKQEKPEWLVKLVFSHKSILLRCTIVSVWYITMTFISYGMMVNSVNLSGNRYLNYMAVAAAEIPGRWTAALLMAKTGRKPVLMGSFFVCALCLIGYIFVLIDNSASLLMYVMGKFSISGVSTTLYTYTAELFPTIYRHSLFNFCSTVGRIGAAAAPLVPAFGATLFEEFPFVMFAGLSIVSGFLVFFTPETSGIHLPDTMEEAENIHTKN